MRRASNRRQIKPVVSPHDGVHGCGGKRCYPSASIAKRVARTARRALETSLEAYHCMHCRKWHLGELELKKTGRPRVDSDGDGDDDERDSPMTHATKKAVPPKKMPPKKMPKKGGY